MVKEPIPNCSYCGGELGEAVIDRKDGTYSHYSSAMCADSLKEQKAKLLLQNQELQNNLELATTQFQAWQKKSDQYRDERDAARTEAQKLHCEVQDASRDLDDMKISEAGWRRTAERAEADLEESNRLLSEEQKKADGLLAHLGALRAVLIIDGGEKLAPEIRKALWLDHDVALDLQRVRREVVEAAKELKTKERWPYLDVGGGRLARALDALEKVEAARVEKGLPLETRIIEKQETEKRKCPDAGKCCELVAPSGLCCICECHG